MLCNFCLQLKAKDLGIIELLLSAAEGQRPRNYSSCCCCLRPNAKDLVITRVVVVVLVVLGFFVWSMPYQLTPPCYPQFLNILNLSIYPSIYLSSSIFFCQSINQPLPFPKYQYIIAADPGAGIGPCCCCSWIFCLIYALSTSTTVLPPIF